MGIHECINRYSAREVRHHRVETGNPLAKANVVTWPICPFLLSSACARTLPDSFIAMIFRR